MKITFYISEFWTSVSTCVSCVYVINCYKILRKYLFMLSVCNVRTLILYNVFILHFTMLLHHDRGPSWHISISLCFIWQPWWNFLSGDENLFYSWWKPVPQKQEKTKQDLICFQCQTSVLVFFQLQQSFSFPHYRG